MNPVLSFDVVGKRFGATDILRDISFEIAAGEFVVLMGESGSGKTTLLRIAAGLERTDRGKVRLRGRAVDGTGEAGFVQPERRGLGMVFQDYALWPHMTCAENVAAALPTRSRDRLATATRLLADVGLEKVRDRRPEQLSGGQQQRVGLARALAAGPDLMLLDEPLSGLDLSVRDRMRGLMRRVLREAGTAALFVSHDPLDAWRLADRVLVLERGAVVQADTPERLHAFPRSYRVARLMGFEGKYPVTLEARDGAIGMQIGGCFQPASPVGVVAAQPGLAMIRPEGVRIGHDGFEAERVDAVFEAGHWRTVWQLAGCNWRVVGMEPARPPVRARIRIDPAHILVFPHKSGSR